MAADITRRRRLPPLGMRIVKTGIAVFFCLLLNYIFNSEVALVSSLAAIVSMQASLENTMKTAIARAAGTALGGAAGIAMLPLAQSVQIDGLYVFLMPVGMILVIYLCVLFHMPKSVSICAYVYITVLVVPISSDIGAAYRTGLIRIADTAFGVTVSLLVNRFIAPPRPVPLKDVDLPVNSFGQVYDRIRRLLPGPKHLVLIDSRLVWPAATRTQPPIESTGITLTGSESGAVSIEVPAAFSTGDTISAVLVGEDYSVRLLNLPQRNGYTAIPTESYPVTVAWHVDQPTGHETYHLIRRSDGTIHRAKVIRRSAGPVSQSLPLGLHGTS